MASSSGMDKDRNADWLSCSIRLTQIFSSSLFGLPSFAEIYIHNASLPEMQRAKKPGPPSNPPNSPWRPETQRAKKPGPPSNPPNSPWRPEAPGPKFVLEMGQVFTALYLLRERGIFVTGTCRKRKGMPEDLMSLKESSMERGDVVWRHTEELSMCTWRDRKLVTILTSRPDVVDQMGTCTRREGRKSRHQCFQQVEIGQPRIVGEYNRYMGGVDLADFLRKKLGRSFRYDKFYQPMFNFGLKTTVVNACILKQEYLSGAQKNNYGVHLFRDALILQLIQRLDPRPAVLPSQNPFAGHYPEQINPQNTQEKRRICVVCAKRKKRAVTSLQCSSCKVALHATCMGAYHEPLIHEPDMKRPKME